MQVWAVWHGGASYAPGGPGDLEQFRSVGDAGEEFRSRANGRGRFAYVCKPPECVDTPAVSTLPARDGGPSMHVYLEDPREAEGGQARPHRIVEFGFRGALRITPPEDDGSQPVRAGTRVVVPALPECDIHKYEKDKSGVEARYDGKTRRGPWAYMCEPCFDTHGTGLGVGRGQQLVLPDESKEG